MSVLENGRLLRAMPSAPPARKTRRPGGESWYALGSDAFVIGIFESRAEAVRFAQKKNGAVRSLLLVFPGSA